MKTVFLRALESEEKRAALTFALSLPGPNGKQRFDVAADSFRAVPRSPFAYWIGDAVREIFGRMPKFETDRRVARRGVNSNDDARFLRLGWECQGPKWQRHVKGGVWSPFYADPYMLVNWGTGVGAAELEAERVTTRVYKFAIVPSREHYFRPGLTWPLRTKSRLSMRAVPAGCVPGSKGPVAYIDGDHETELLALLAVCTSRAFQALVELQLAAADAKPGGAAHSFEVGVIQLTPVPVLADGAKTTLAALARQAWSIRRSNDESTEYSNAFSVPGIASSWPVGEVWSLDRMVGARQHILVERDSTFARLQAAIDAACYGIYQISDHDRQTMEEGFGDASNSTEVGDGDSEDDVEDVINQAIDAATLVYEFLSWTLGISFGRFDLRLATGERPLPPEPDPFDPLPPCSPGMLTGADGLPLAAPPPNYPISFPTDGILVDDPGHDRDLLARIHQVFDVVFPGHGAERLHEAVTILDPAATDLRPWLRRTFFEEHIQRYSKSRRKAPIYWRLGTPSGSYSVWIYLHRFARDTLHRVLNDHVAPKLLYESNKLATLQSEAGPSPSPSQRRALADQETIVDELRTLQAELDRVLPLWDPDLDDGVVINASFLHRLFAHTRAWQKECESHWQKLQKGEYDWAHLAMRLWPERVVPKCTEDRSLAIAHGLEDVLWLEGADGKWRPLPVTDAQVAALVQERTSTAVKDALRRMGETPEPVPVRKARATAPVGEPKAPRKAKVAAEPGAIQVGLGLPDDPTPAELNAVRAALDGVDDGLAKADLLAACGLDEGACATALAALVQTGEVVKIGAGRGTRYRLGGGA